MCVHFLLSDSRRDFISETKLLISTKHGLFSRLSFFCELHRYSPELGKTLFMVYTNLVAGFCYKITDILFLFFCFCNHILSFILNVVSHQMTQSDVCSLHPHVCHLFSPLTASTSHYSLSTCVSPYAWYIPSAQPLFGERTLGAFSRLITIQPYPIYATFPNKNHLIQEALLSVLHLRQAQFTAPHQQPPLLKCMYSLKSFSSSNSFEKSL